jgi:hypothetical protein
LGGETERLYGQNRDQYIKIHGNTEAIAALKTELEAIKVDLIGVTGSNGLRGEFRAYKKDSEERDAAMIQTLSEMSKKQETNLKWTVGLLLSVPALVAGVVALAGG